MAKLKKGILGPISGKLGPVTGGTWKGIPYLRISPDPARTKDRSRAQLANQEKFKPFDKIEYSKRFKSFTGFTPKEFPNFSVNSLLSINIYIRGKLIWRYSIFLLENEGKMGEVFKTYF